MGASKTPTETNICAQTTVASTLPKGSGQPSHRKQGGSSSAKTLVVVGAARWEGRRESRSRRCPTKLKKKKKKTQPAKRGKGTRVVSGPVRGKKKEPWGKEVETPRKTRIGSEVNLQGEPSHLFN